MNNRLVALDFTKGALVAFMVIYHCLNYLGYESLPHDFLSFVPPSFILIAGFLITHVHAPGKGAASKSLAARLAIRSFKLVLLFTLLNVAASMVFSSLQGALPGLPSGVNRLFEIFVIGGSPGVAFEVLLPIGYLLILSIPVLLLQSRIPVAVTGVSAALVAACLIAEQYRYPVYNLYMLSSGFIGMAIGQMRNRTLESLTWSWILPGCLYALYWLAFLTLGDRYGLQLFATLVSVLILYVAGRHIDSRRWMPAQILMLGRYSLLAYIMQIFYLQLFKRSFLFGDFDANGTALVILAILLLTWATMRVVDRVREKNGFSDRAYRLIFA